MEIPVLLLQLFERRSQIRQLLSCRRRHDSS
jgi:hypothetical protein